jgi:hypothetical protein
MAKKKRGVKFYLKVIVTFFLLIFVAMGIGVYYVFHQLTTGDKFDKLLMKKMSETTKLNISFASLDVSFPDLSLKDVRIATDSNKLKLKSVVKQLDITPDLWAAFKGELVLDAFSLSSTTAELTLPQKSELPQPDTKSSKAEKLDLSSFKFPLNNFFADSVKVIYKQQGKTEVSVFILKNARLEKSMLASSLPFGFDLHAENYAHIRTEGSLSWPESVKAQITLDNVNQARLLELLPPEYKNEAKKFSKPRLSAEINYNVTKQKLDVAKLNLTAEPGVAIEGNMSITSFSPVNAQGELSMQAIEIKTLHKLVKDYLPKNIVIEFEKGKLAPSVAFNVASSSLKAVTAECKLDNIVANADLLKEKITVNDARIIYKDNKIELPDLRAEIAGSRLSLKNGQVEISPVKFLSEISADIDFSKSWALAKPYLPDSATDFLPNGKAEFAGKISYQKDNFSVDGQLKSDHFNLQQKQYNARADLKNIDIIFKELGMKSGELKVNSLNLDVLGSELKVSGSVKNAEDPGFALNARGQVDLGNFSKFAASLFKLPVKEEQFSGNISIDLKLGGTLSQLKPDGKLEFKNVRSSLPERGLLIENFNGVARADSNQLVVEKLNAGLAGGNLELSGSLKDFKKPVVKADMSLKNADINNIRNFLQKNFDEFPAEIEMSGNTDVTFKMTGQISQPNISGQADVKGGRFFHPAIFRPLEKINGPVAFNNKGLTTTGVRALWGKSAALVKGAVNDWGKLETDLSYEVDPLAATDAAGFFLKDTGYKLESDGTGKGNVVGPVDKIKVTGKADLPKGTFSAPVSEDKKDHFKFPFQNLTASFYYHDKIFNILKANAKLFTGNVNASGKIDLAEEPIKFSFDTKLDQLETSEFLKVNTKFKDVVKGGLDGTAKMSGNTTGLNSLDGDASLLMKKGAYSSPPVVQKICKQLKAEHLASGPINNLSGDYKIARGRISSNNTMATSVHGKMVYKGSVGLDATADGELSLEIVRESCQKSPVLKQLVGKRSSLTVPVTVKGSILSPSIGIPLDRMLKDAAQNRVKEELEDKAKDALGNIFKSKKTEETTTQNDATNDQKTGTDKQPEKKSTTEQLEDKVKDLGKNLNKIFKF